MCIIFNDFPKLHKTIKNHTVYKVFRHDGSGYSLSPYSVTKWSINELKEEKEISIIIKKTAEKTEIRSANGLYCFRNKSLAKKLLDKLEIYKKLHPFFFFPKDTFGIATCIIPKDSIYYEQNGEIVTNRLKITKFIKK